MNYYTEQHWQDRDRLFSLLYSNSFEYKPEGVTLSSEIESNFYVDCRRVTYSAEGAPLVGRIVYDTIQMFAPLVKAVGGIGFGAIPIAVATAIHSARHGTPLNAFAVREVQKEHGLKNAIEGPKLPPRTPVCIVEDAVTTSGSMMKAIATTREAELNIVLGIVLVDRQEGLPGKPLGMEEIRSVIPNVVVIFTRDSFFAVKEAGSAAYLGGHR